jgi:predicted Zn-dependent peptidase
MAKYYKYDSGLTLLYENNKINKSTSIDISFDCGARCDGGLAGLSHFCEHMFFTGTDKLSKQEVTKRYFDFIKTNAYTSYTDILFTGNIMTNRLGDFLVAVQDMICNSTFTKQAIEEEKKIVIQEIVRDADQHSRHAGRFKAYELYGLEHFQKGILGNKESVEQIKSKDVKNYVKKYFVKNNCTISISSPLSFNKVKGIIKRYFDSTMPSNNLKPLPYKQNKLLNEQKVSLYNKDIDKNFLAITFMFDRKGPDLKYRAIIGAICNMIDDISDGLTKELRLDNSLIYSMGSDYMINNVNSFFELSTEVCSENIKPCLDVIFNYINKLRVNGFTKEQFSKELEKDEYYWQTRVATPSRIQNNLTRYRFYNKFVSDKDIHNQVQSLTLDDINDTMRKLFDDTKIQVFVYGNATKKDVYTINQIQKKFN